ncbi:hypothetical protein BDZ89DRAFT_1146367 [Hymenopellis radicata]|nr:hypothetical protein BDZ89DRAFT_1146367 [Hymenopellis radicata]
MASRGIVLIQPRQITQAREQLSLTDQPEMQRKTKKKPSKPMEPAKARLITETVCLIAALNREYGNPPAETAYLDCVAAKRRLLCSLCAQRYGRNQPVVSPSYPPEVVLPPPFLLPAPKSKAKSSDKISKEDRVLITSRLQDLAIRIWRENHVKDEYRHLPRSAYFPPSLSKLVISRIRSLGSVADLLSLIGPLSWRFAFQYGSDLYSLIAQIQVSQFPARKKAHGKRRRVESDETRWMLNLPRRVARFPNVKHLRM